MIARQGDKIQGTCACSPLQGGPPCTIHAKTTAGAPGCVTHSTEQPSFPLGPHTPGYAATAISCPRCRCKRPRPLLHPRVQHTRAWLTHTQRGSDHHHHHQPCWAGPGPGLPNNATSAVTAAGTVGAAVPQRHCSCAAQQGQLAAWGRSTCTDIHMHVDVHHAPCMWAPPRVLCIASSAAACVLSDGEQSGVLKHC